MKKKFMEICRSKATAANKPLSDDDVAFLETIADGIEQAVSADNVERNKQLTDLAAKVGVLDEGETFSGVVRKIAEKVDALEAKTNRTLSPDDKFKLRRMLEDKKEEITSAMKAQREKNPALAKDWVIEFRAKRTAAALMTTSTVLTGAVALNNPNVLDDMEVLVIQYPKNFIIDAIGGRQVSNVPATLRWKEQTTESVDATGVVTEGSTKNLADKKFVWKTADRVKYAGRIEFTEELTMDFDQLLLQIIDMFEQQVLRAYNAGVQAAILAWASTYTSTELDNTYILPGVSQVIQAGKLWVENNSYMPDMVMLRPGDAALATIQQNTDGDITYIPEAVAFHGLTPFVSMNIPEGYIAVGTSNVVKEQHSAFILRRGTYGTQFIENEETIVGEIFSLTKLPTVSKGSWVYMPKDTIIAALRKQG